MSATAHPPAPSSNPPWSPWTPAQIGDLTGRVALVTGANSGIGFEVALELAAHGAHTVLGCRSAYRAEESMATIASHAPGASVEVLSLDLADLASVRAAAAAFDARHDRLDLLVNNAGIMAPPFQKTSDGFEVQMATNHLGHFALTGLLLDPLLLTPGSRVVTVSSLLHRLARPKTLTLSPAGPYRRWQAYGASKLANLLFAYELARRLHATTSASVAAHPGWARSNLAANGLVLGASPRAARLARLAGSSLGQSTARGAAPVLMAATSAEICSGELVGPARAGGLFGPPVRSRSSRSSLEGPYARALWEESERCTGVRYDLSGPGPG